MRNLGALAFVAALGGAVLGWAMQTASAETPTVIRIGTPDSSAGATPSGGVALTTFLDMQKLLDKEFAKDGIKIEWSYFKGAGPAVNEALANKQLDFAYIGDLAGIIGKTAGLGTHFLAASRGGNAYLAVAPNSGITTIADLKGKTVTVLKGSAYELSLDKALAHAGLSERDLKVVNLDWNAASAALAAKQLDADYSALQVVALQDQGLAKIALTTKDLGRAYTFQAGILGRDEFIAANPELTQRFINVVVAADHYLSQPEHMDDFIAQTSARSGFPAALGHDEFDGEDPKFRFSPRLDDFMVDSFQSSADLAKQLGLTRNAFDAKAWVEPKFVDQAIATQKLGGFWPLYDKDGKPQQ